MNGEKYKWLCVVLVTTLLLIAVFYFAGWLVSNLLLEVIDVSPDRIGMVLASFTVALAIAATFE